MATVILFHSVYGLRAVEHAAAERLRAAGHAAVTPDLYAGRTAETVEDGFALRDAIGWPALCARADRAVEGLPAAAVLAGHSMGVGIVAHLWPQRPQTAGVLGLHGLPEGAMDGASGVPVQAHLAEPDPFEEEAYVADWTQRSGPAVTLFRYPGAGHLFTDATLPDHDAAACDLAWRRALAFLEAL